MLNSKYKPSALLLRKDRVAVSSGLLPIPAQLSSVTLQDDELAPCENQDFVRGHFVSTYVAKGFLSRKVRNSGLNPVNVPSSCDVSRS